MKQLLVSGLLAAALYGASITKVQAEPSRYLVLTPPSPAGYTSRPVQPVAKSAYSWGWFGAQPRSHTYGHTGYYGDRWKRTVR